MKERAPLVYRFLLFVAWPGWVRREQGAELEAMFVRCLHTARRRDGRMGVVLAWVRGAVDIVAAGLYAHFTQRSARSHSHEEQRTMTRTSLRHAGAEFGRDIRFATRALMRDRLFTVTALLTLIVCLAGNAAIFSVVRSVLLKPLPIADVNRVVLVSNIYPNATPPLTGPGESSASVPEYFDRVRDMTVFEMQAMYRRTSLAMDLAGGARRTIGMRATPSFYTLLRAKPLRGRLFEAAEGEPGNDSKAILSYGFWQREFGGDESIVGRDVHLNGTAFRVVGIMPRTFQYVWNDIDLWLPESFTPVQKSDASRHSTNWNMIARLKPGATVQQAQLEVDALNARTLDRFPELKPVLVNAGYRTVIAPLQDEVVRGVRPTLYLLWAGVVLVLLVGGVNLANLFMVRAASRSREMAIRHAMGAGLGRLGRQLLTETTFLTLTGGIIGIGVAWWLLRSATAFHLELLPRGHEIHLDAPSIVAMIALAALVGVVTGLTPLVQLRRMSLNETMRDGGRGGSHGAAPNRLRNALATAQVAFAFVLLVGAGLLVASFRAVLAINPGFDTSHVATASLSLPFAQYTDNEDVVAVTDRLLAGIRALPGVTAAGVTSGVPFGDNFNSSVIIPEGYHAKPGESVISPLQIAVTGGYFDAMRVPLKSGRVFDARDAANAGPVVIVDERLAKRFWPNQDAVGRRVYLPQAAEEVVTPPPTTRWITVVGVVKNGELTGLAPEHPLFGTYYFPQAQVAQRSLMFAVRTDGDPQALVPALRKAVAAVDASLPLFGVQTMDERLETSLVPRRLPMMLAMAFGLVALFLAGVGIYGVLAYRVAQRRREIGIRLALGSTAREILGLVLRDGTRIIAVGLAIGALGLVAVTKVLGRLLYGVQPTDPAVIGLVVVVLSAVALVATLIPARRAARVDPVSALSE